MRDISMFACELTLDFQSHPYLQVGHVALEVVQRDLHQLLTVRARVGALVGVALPHYQESSVPLASFSALGSPATHAH